MSPIGKYEPILRIAELGSLTRAAESLGYSQSSLSHLTANLEKELGVKLFRRERQGVTLTPAGTELLGIMEEIEAKENKLRVAAAAQQSSTLRIGTLPSITATWLPTLLEQFYAQFPRTAVQLVERDGYDELLTCLQREEVDCTFYVGNHSPAWSAAPLWRDEYVVVVPRNHPLAQQPSVGMEALYPYPFLPSTGRVETSPLARLYHRLSPPEQLTAHLSTDAGVLQLVSSGFGFTIFSRLILAGLPPSQRVTVIPFAPAVYRTILFLSPAAAPFNGVTQTFLRLTKAYLKQWEAGRGGSAGPQTHETMRDGPPRDAASQSACSRRGHQRCPFPQHARRKSTVPDGFCLSCLQKSRGTLPAAAFKKPPSPVKRENRKPRRGIPVWAFGL